MFLLSKQPCHVLNMFLTFWPLKLYVLIWFVLTKKKFTLRVEIFAEQIFVVLIFVFFGPFHEIKLSYTNYCLTTKISSAKFKHFLTAKISSARFSFSCCKWASFSKICQNMSQARSFFLLILGKKSYSKISSAKFVKIFHSRK